MPGCGRASKWSKSNAMHDNRANYRRNAPPTLQAMDLSRRGVVSHGKAHVNQGALLGIYLYLVDRRTDSYSILGPGPSCSYTSAFDVPNIQIVQPELSMHLFGIARVPGAGAVTEPGGWTWKDPCLCARARVCVCACACACACACTLVPVYSHGVLRHQGIRASPTGVSTS
jgi:hypothetical protein